MTYILVMTLMLPSGAIHLTQVDWVFNSPRACKSFMAGTQAPKELYNAVDGKPVKIVMQCLEAKASQT